MEARPILIVFGSIVLLALLLNFFVAPFIDSPNMNSALISVYNSIDNGFLISLGSVVTFNTPPVSFLWLGINPINVLVLNDLKVMSYLPDALSISILVILLLCLVLTVVMIVSGT